MHTPAKCDVESKDRKKGDRNSFLLSPNDEDTQELSELPAPIADDVQRRSSVSHHEIDDHPDFELYYASGSLTVPVVILTLSTMGISLMMLVLASAGGMQMTGLLQISFNPWGIIPLLILFSVYSSILFSFLVTRIGSKAGALRRGKRHLARALHTLVVMFFLTFPLFLYVASSFVWYSVCVVIGFYILCSLFYLCAR